MLTLLPKKIIEDSICRRTTPHADFRKKFETTLMVYRYSGAWGKLIHEKNLKTKSSWHCPFNGKLCKFVWKIWCDVGTIVSFGKRHFDWRMRSVEDSHM
jgi:hypothetical protein